MLEEFLQGALTSGGKEARAAYVKAGAVLLGSLWQTASSSHSPERLHRLPPGLLYQVHITVQVLNVQAALPACTVAFGASCNWSHLHAIITTMIAARILSILIDAMMCELQAQRSSSRIFQRKEFCFSLLVAMQLTCMQASAATGTGTLVALILPYPGFGNYQYLHRSPALPWALWSTACMG